MTVTPLSHDELREANEAYRRSRDMAWAKVETLARALRVIRETSSAEVYVNIATRALDEAGVEDPDDFVIDPNCATCGGVGVVGNGNAMFPEPCPTCSPTEGGQDADR